MYFIGLVWRQKTDWLLQKKKILIQKTVSNQTLDYIKEGLKAALYDKLRSGQPKKYKR